MKATLSRLVPAGFARNVGMLVGGTALSQVILLVALPILTRIYSPDDFGILAIYMSCLAIISSVACLRLEIAIPLPEKDVQAVELVALAFFSASFITVGSIVCLLFFSAELAELLGKPNLAMYLWLLPVGLMGAASFAAIQYWASRKKQFSVIARARIQQSALGVGTQLLIGYFVVGPLGLIVGQIVIVTGGAFLLARTAWKDVRPLLSNISFTSLFSTLVEYKNFPKYSALETLCSNGAMQIPILVIAIYVAGPEVGFLLLAMKVMAAPMTLLGGAIGQVYLSQASERYRDGMLPQFTVGVLKNLCLIGAPLILAGGLLAPIVFPIIFGTEWQRAGDLTLCMVPWFIFQFMAAPISMALHITNNQRTALSLQLFGLSIRVVTVFIAAGFGAGQKIVEFYILSGAVFYAIYLATVLLMIKVSVREVLVSLVPGFAASTIVFGLYFVATDILK